MIEPITARPETDSIADALTALEPNLTSLAAAVQLRAAVIAAKRAEGVGWEAIAQVFRSAGFPDATAANVRTAFSRGGSKKVRKARASRTRTAHPLPTSAPAQAPTEAMELFGTRPRIVERKFPPSG